MFTELEVAGDTTTSLLCVPSVSDLELDSQFSSHRISPRVLTSLLARARRLMTGSPYSNRYSKCVFNTNKLKVTSIGVLTGLPSKTQWSVGYFIFKSELRTELVQTYTANNNWTINFDLTESQIPSGSTATLTVQYAAVKTANGNTDGNAYSYLHFCLIMMFLQSLMDQIAMSPCRTL
jgi:hypothetical protein